MWPWVAAALAVLLLVVAGVIVLAQRDDDDSTAADGERGTTTSESGSPAPDSGNVVLPDELGVGDCFNDSGHGTSEVGEVSLAECVSLHDGEVFALVTLPGAADASYPGDAEVERLSDELCLDEFAPYVGVDYLDSRWEFGYFVPQEAAWRKYDERGVICYLVDPEYDKIEGAKRDTRT